MPHQSPKWYNQRNYCRYEKGEVMNQTKIEWCDSTWNPVTGCKHNCQYCYARRIAKRFMPHEMEYMNVNDCRPIIPEHTKHLGCYECEGPVVLRTFAGEKIRITPYPEGFKPTFHKHRLSEPAKKTKGQRIFVCSMADLFGDWVPNSWIQDVFEACMKAPKHRYLFLTKNPARYESISNNADNFWFGATATDKWSMDTALFSFMQQRVNAEKHFNTFLSIEPLLERIPISQYDGYFSLTDWVIIGAQTGPGAIPPQKEWIQEVVDQCDSYKIPVFMKDSLIPIVGESNMRRDMPEGLLTNKVR